jgi:hypothetical protein
LYKDDEEASKMRDRVSHVSKLDDTERHLLELQQRAKKAKEMEEELIKQKQKQTQTQNEQENISTTTTTPSNTETNINEPTNINNNNQQTSTQPLVSEKLKEVKITLQPISKNVKTSKLIQNEIVDETNSNKRKFEVVENNESTNTSTNTINKKIKKQEGWLFPDLIVKITNKTKFPKYYGQKGR